MRVKRSKTLHFIAPTYDLSSETLFRWLKGYLSLIYIFKSNMRCYILCITLILAPNKMKILLKKKETRIFFAMSNMIRQFDGILNGLSITSILLFIIDSGGCIGGRGGGGG